MGVLGSIWLMPVTVKDRKGRGSSAAPAQLVLVQMVEREDNSGGE